MFLFILQSLYFFLPAFMARIIPSFFSKISLGDKHLHPKIMISPKELVLATLTSTLVFILQMVAYRAGFQSITLIDYAGFTPLLGVLMGVGVIAGNALKNYYKQKDGISLNSNWLPWDSWGYVFGAILFSFLEYVPDVSVVVILLVASPLFEL